MSSASSTVGRRIVFIIYGIAVVVAGLFGYIVGFVIQPNINGHVGSLGPIVFELTPLNLAVYGIIMVGMSLGVGLLLVSYASRHEDTEAVTIEQTDS